MSSVLDLCILSGRMLQSRTPSLVLTRPHLPLLKYAEATRVRPTSQSQFCDLCGKTLDGDFIFTKQSLHRP